ncbi:hypothetical protein [Bosea psychrotolerans]|uniref:Uncharacterized protein n=1 Tax=Bosea psychrotolerans TaxID=1871628 RepID=A0A2S4M861_9HYPH|nr:hypothetical protein [Bosea psychrotolerans]POR50805.1 hypothetical protein CYD53_10853 [Bosea psychrotolerans]
MGGPIEIRLNWPMSFVVLGLIALADLIAVTAVMACPANKPASGPAVLTNELVRRHGWQPGVCWLVELSEPGEAVADAAPGTQVGALEQQLTAPTRRASRTIEDSATP